MGTRSSLIVLGVAATAAAAACGKTVVVPSEHAPITSASTARPEPPKLAACAIANDRVARRTLYSWTTKQQVDELAKSRILLTRTESPVLGGSYYEQVVERLSEQSTTPNGTAIALLLRAQAFAKARFAWVSPWPTAIGFQGESYGDRLLTIVLRPDAWLAKVYASKSTIEIVDMDDRPVDLELAQKNPQRIAGAYFVQDVVVTAKATGGGTAALFRSAADTARFGYREYVVFNESMVFEWSIGTPRESTAIVEARDALEGFQSKRPLTADASEVAFNTRVTNAWSLSTPSPFGDEIALYEACLALPSDAYQPRRGSLERLIDRLKKLPLGDAQITHQPHARFPEDQLTPRPLLKPRAAPRPPRTGTY